MTLTLCKTALLVALDNTGKPQPVKVYRPFVLVILSYCNQEYIEKNLQSVYRQNYPNFRVIYVDDHSTDATLKEARKWKKRFKRKCPFTLRINGANKGAMQNMYEVVSELDNEEIVVVLDGDDWLSNPFSLDRLNRYYQDDDVWMTYGQYIEWPKKIGGLSRPFTMKDLKEGRVKQVGWRSSHLRSYYAGLFKKIAKAHLMKEGEFFSIASDVAAMLPMLEMAREHAIFIPETLYVYNKGNPRNDCKCASGKQLATEAYIRALPVYPKLRVHPARG